jgi:uroporphyrinogen-III synthase
MAKSPRVLVTRTANQAAAFSQKLRQAGFTPVEFPAIMLQPLPWEPLDEALAVLNGFDWLIFTSGNAVDFFLRRVDALDFHPDQWPRVATVGSATARLLTERGIAIDYMPDEFVGTELVLGLGDLTGQKVLLPRAKIGRPEIAALLQARGAQLTEVALYDTVTAVPTPKSWAELNKGIAAITFTSPSSVRNFFKIINAHPDRLTVPLAQMMQQALIVCIGPVTADAAAKAGLTDTLIPEAYTIDGMVRQLKTALFKETT